MSKGRWETRLTSKALEKIKVPYSIVIEPQEYEKYAEYIDKTKILTLPFSNLGFGSITARNWIWRHAINSGAKRHWILDDNIEAFNRLNRNNKPEVQNGAIFKAAEDFVDRYENVAIAGFNYYSLARAMEKLPPFYLNTRVYSCILIDNSIPFRWRGKYNEDTDLSLRVLKAGYCTVLFNAFLAGKVATMTMKGGNTDELYAGDGRKTMAEALVKMHPDVTKVVWRFNRWQHQVNYEPFRANALKKKPEFVIPEDCTDITKIQVNNYGMVLIDD